MPAATGFLSRNFLDEPFVWILVDEKEREKERQALWTYTGPEAFYGPSSNIPFRARANYRSQASSADPNRFALNGFASSTSSP
jgi:hypothetical protein